MTPKKEKCGLGAEPLRTSLKKVRPVPFSASSLRQAQSRTIIQGGHPVRLWFQSCDVLGGKLKTRRPKSAFGGILFSD